MHQGGNLASALAEPPLKCSGYGKTNAIFYQLAMVFRDCSGSRGRNAYACGPVHSLADRGSGSKINWPFRLQACRRQRERERGREKKKEVEGRGEKKEKEGGKESGAERVDIHLSDTTQCMSSGWRSSGGTGGGRRSPWRPLQCQVSKMGGYEAEG